MRRRETPAERAIVTAELFALGEDMQRAKARGRNPAASPEEQEQEVLKWLLGTGTGEHEDLLRARLQRRQR